MQPSGYLHSVQIVATVLCVIEDRVDGRSVLRAQRRQAIVTAARRLATSSGATGFTVDEVAAAAGVSRRTVFNQFATFEGLLIGVCEEILADVTQQVLDQLDDRLAPIPGEEARAAVALDALCAAVSAADLPVAMTDMVRVLNGAAQDKPRGDAISQAALDQVGERLRDRVLTHAPDLDELVVQLTVSLLMTGVGVVARRWLTSYAAEVTHASRRAWDAHMRKLTEQLAGGYRGVARRDDARAASA